MRHVLVTNDFPPKVGGIQTLLYDLWSTLPPDSFAVLTTPYAGAAEFDARQPFQVERTLEPWLLPHGWMRRRIDDLVERFGADLVVLDPALPLGLIGPHLSRPYDLVVHGAEVVIPSRLPISRPVLNRVLRNARQVISIGAYTANEMERSVRTALPHTVVPPGVDTHRFVPLDAEQRRQERVRLGLDPDKLIIAGVSRLVPRKGFDMAIEAVARLAPSHPQLELVIVGTGRDRGRLERLAAAKRAPVTFLGRVDHDDLPAIYGSADLFTMLCYNRWGGLEQEGFGIVFLEAAACGVPQIAGRSGGADEAVLDGSTGLVVEHPRSLDEVTEAFEALIDDPARRHHMGLASRERVEAEFADARVGARLARVLGIETAGGESIPR